jgi:hypothetical protein
MMNTVLRHISGPNLKLLEAELAKVEAQITVVGVNYTPSGNWYIHFLIQGVEQESVKVKTVRVEKTRSSSAKKGGE